MVYLYTYKTGLFLGQMLVNIAYMEHMGLFYMISEVAETVTFGQPFAENHVESTLLKLETSNLDNLGINLHGDSTSRSPSLGQHWLRTRTSKSFASCPFSSYCHALNISHDGPMVLVEKC